MTADAIVVRRARPDEAEVIGVHALDERRGCTRRPDRDGDIEGFHLIADRLDL